MESIPALVFAIPILLIGVALAVQPLLTNGAAAFRRNESSATQQLRQQADLLEERARLYNALLELDFDYSVDKVAEADYARQRYILMAQAIRVLRQLDALARVDDPIEKAVRAYHTGQVLNADGCHECGYLGKASDRFCRGCGAPLQAGPQEVAHATR